MLPDGLVTSFARRLRQLLVPDTIARLPIHSVPGFDVAFARLLRNELGGISLGCLGIGEGLDLARSGSADPTIANRRLAAVHGDLPELAGFARDELEMPHGGTANRHHGILFS